MCRALIHGRGLGHRMGMIYWMSLDTDHPKDQQKDGAAKHSNEGEVAGEMRLRVGRFGFRGEGVVKGEGVSMIVVIEDSG